MYTWAAFFVTAGALYGYLALQENKRSDWIKFGLATLASAFTHYYALLAVTVLNVLLFVWLLLRFITTKDKKKFTSYLITAGAVVLCYFPWIFILFGQAKRFPNLSGYRPSRKMSSGILYSIPLQPSSGHLDSQEYVLSVQSYSYYGD